MELQNFIHNPTSPEEIFSTYHGVDNCLVARAKTEEEIFGDVPEGSGSGLFQSRQVKAIDIYIETFESTGSRELAEKAYFNVFKN